MEEMKARVLLMVLTLPVLLVSVFGVFGVKAQFTAITMETSPFVSEVGQMFTVNVWIRDVDFLHSWQAVIYYDSSILYTNETMITEGYFLKIGGLTYFAVFLGPGYVQVGGLITENAKVDGSGIVAYIGFRVGDTGKSNLIFDPDPTQTKLLDLGLNPIFFEAFDAEFYTTVPRASFYYLPNRSPPALDWIPDPSLIRDPVEGEQITFNASQYILGTSYLGSYDSDGTITSYTWDFGDSNKTITATPLVTHAYDTSGTYAVSLNVTDNEGKSDVSATQYVGVQPAAPVPPTASFTYSPESPLPVEYVTFDASSSTANGGIITYYAWDFGDGNKDTGAITTNAYMSPGDFTVTLNVTDSEGLWDTDTKTVKVVPERTIIQEFIVDSTPFNVTITSNSTVSNIAFNVAQKMISFNVTGPNGTSGYANVIVPLNIMWGPWTILVDDAVPPDSGESTNATHNLIYVAYNHSSHTVTLISTGIMPEFPIGIILTAVFILVALAGAIIGRKETSKTHT